MPPAFSQSACVVCLENSSVVPDGLADGEVVLPVPLVPVLPDGLADGGVDEPPDPLPTSLPEDVPEPLAPPDVPDGLLDPDPLAPPLCAAATTGASAKIPTRNPTINFFI